MTAFGMHLARLMAILLGGGATIALGVALLAAPAESRELRARTVLEPMLGVWAPDLESCIDRPEWIEDSKLEVRTDAVQDFVTIWILLGPWEVDGTGMRAMALVGEEGGDEQPEEPVEVRIELFPEGILAFGERGVEPHLLVRCPPGTRVH